MKKKLVSSVLVSTLLLTMVPSFALGSTEITPSTEILIAQNQLEEVLSEVQAEEVLAQPENNTEVEVTINEQHEQESVQSTEPSDITVEELEDFDEAFFDNVDLESLAKDLDYSELDVDPDDIAMYVDIQKYVSDNQNESVVDIVQHFDKEFGNEPTVIGIVANAGYKEYYSEWTKLTTKEKVLVAASPISAGLTKTTQSKAYAYTDAEFGYNGLGDKSDAFRHAMWNALMSRYISKAWAEVYATAHEAKSTSELQKKATDGNLESAHRKMDLYNNQVGRDCWYWNSGFPWTSNEDLLKRVRAKLKNKELTWLNS